ncbi:MAG: sialate O-acetylesterase [Sphaerochaeta sp.]|jgi:hypothetical protein|nr:sialate O-acetylesterase [Sphaerochaeta sp.]
MRGNNSEIIRGKIEDFCISMSEKHKRIPRVLCAILIMLFLYMPVVSWAQQHVVILSGQSNMARLDYTLIMAPMLDAEFGAGAVEIIKVAAPSMPISQWISDTRPMYLDILQQFNQLDASNLESITFVWLQGETDALRQSISYQADLTQLIQQVQQDISPYTNFVICRINDYQWRSPYWQLVRDAQVEIAEALPNGTWINTDDLNNYAGFNLLHNTPCGSQILANRIGDLAIHLIGQDDG